MSSRKRIKTMQKTSLGQKIILLLFGVCLSVILLELGLRLGGFIYLSVQEHRNKVSLQKKGAYRILCIGESTTELGGRDSYPRQLEEILNQQNTGITFSVINKGVAGYKSSQILLELEKNIQKYSPDMVLTMIGINDSGRKRLEEEGRYTVQKPSWIESLRVYKLADLLYRHMRQKIKETRGSSLTAQKVSSSAQPDEILSSGAKEVESVPAEDQASNESYLDIGDNFQEKGEYEDAIKAYKKYLEMIPENYDTFVRIGNCFYSLGEFPEAEFWLKRAIEIKPSEAEAFVSLGWTYGHWWKRKGTQLLAKEAFKRAREVNPNDPNVYIESAYFYREPGEVETSEKLLKEALQVAPQDAGVYLSLGYLYLEDLNRVEASEEMFKKALELDPESDQAYFQLLRYYVFQNAPVKAEAIFNKAVEAGKANEDFYRLMGTCYENQRKYKRAQEFLKKANNESRYYCLETRHDYHRIRDIVLAKKLDLVAIQYPMRPIGPLKALLGESEQIALVDNEDLFKEKIAREGYDEYFVDKFALDFGHCTRKGNRLLATNIAKTVLTKLNFSYHFSEEDQ